MPTSGLRSLHGSCNFVQNFSSSHAMNLQDAMWRPENHNKFKEKRLYKRFLNNATQGLSFSEEVVCEMGPISYGKHDFSGLFHPTGPLASATKLKKVKKHKNNDMHYNINSLARETCSVSVQAFQMYSNRSKRFNALARTGQINVQCACLTQTSTEDWVAQSRNSKCQEFAQKKLGKTEQGFINQQFPKDKCQNKSGPLLPLRKQHRVLGHVSFPVIQNPCDGSHVFHTKSNSKQEIFTVDKWRRFWNIKLPLHSVTTEGLKKALIDPNYSVRLEAIITCASGAVHGLQQNREPAQCERWKARAEDQELQDLIVSALDDPVRRVQMAAAVCQYVIRTPNSKAKDIIQSALKQDLSGTGADSWMAAQCLAIHGDIGQAVIQRLLSQHFICDSPSDRKQSMVLLSRISRKSTLVRSLLAEELNNGNWRTRFQACKSIAQLRGPINKDLCSKLIHMMWNDWSCDVRKAAAHTLSKLDMDTVLQNELSVKLKEGPNVLRLEALKFIDQLNIMTPKLLPSFLQCFNDDYVAVRTQACLTAATLMIEDQAVLDQLINLMQNDPLWEVKVEAINANYTQYMDIGRGKVRMFKLCDLSKLLTLGKIGCMTTALKKLLMWALHLEEEPCVRIAACEVLSMLEPKDPELQQFLQERYAMEPNTEVKWHIEGFLKKHGHSLEKEESKIQEIKQQVASDTEPIHFLLK
ncbi:HEAT repeat-containing protein 4 isoform X5 [Triplophysa dalaica]|uniref:HEAT repeat-containing protein 4 isoform X5 n=1 Tax=Triplophysa dalaica TaxID=1582913 RepID=UPI0024E00306|nr:HEAT repeat-containing protein 4 isoform X5 [Triplophysa dalaica]